MIVDVIIDIGDGDRHVGTLFVACDHCPQTHDMWPMGQFASGVQIGYDAVNSFKQMRRENCGGV
ncbi:MAG: hypothetical protein Q8J68_11025 [Methanolobus sp.]|uniref:hypothetical protein n=1 Tax=Methanolobus sp. TaxID=1874737 RepID=UPI002730C23F|nr:hypothetical protein [Methanolobus sp.]MDP2217803.1 hypothetical protein [Methanolobus sp.]